MFILINDGLVIESNDIRHIKGQEVIALESNVKTTSIIRTHIPEDKIVSITLRDPRIS